MVYQPPIHGILPPLPMVYRLPLTMVYRPPCPWNIDPPTYGISNPLLWYYELLSFGRNEGGSIYYEGVQNTMTNKFTPGSKYHLEN